jgi:DNA-binding FrmR family transcriptional regulator
LSAYYEGNKEELLERLRKVEGQIRGIQRMIDEDRYCIEVVTQLAAVRAAINRVTMGIVECYTRGCVADAVHSGKPDAKIEELVNALVRYVK